GQGGMGPGMMGQGGMGPGMMKGMMGSGMMPCPMMGGSGMGMQQLLEPEQRSEMRELIQGHRQEQLEGMGQMMNLRDDLMALMQEARPDPDEIQALHGQMAELHGEMLADRVRHHNALNDLLTDEQREQLQQAMPEGITPEDHESHH
ncbi:Spy/CpxP family protein refolding chaperone, partial [Halomonas sp. NO4]|uniref:Spy/CpxP family protein refolding chaperone n=1 Tax=Halomonas sp. NO4 TaxID=2484813 RepID=UPI0013D0407F